MTRPEPYTGVTPGSSTLRRVWCRGRVVLATNDCNRAEEAWQMVLREERRAGAASSVKLEAAQ